MIQPVKNTGKVITTFTRGEPALMNVRLDINIFLYIMSTITIFNGLPKSFIL